MTNIFSTTQPNKNNKTIGHNMNDDHVNDLDDDEWYVWQDKYHFAKSLFDLKEYDRCAHVLSSSSTTSASLSSHHMSNKSENGLLQLKNSKLNRTVLFLSFYARYLVCFICFICCDFTFFPCHDFACVKIVVHAWF